MSEHASDILLNIFNKEIDLESLNKKAELTSSSIDKLIMDKLEIKDSLRDKLGEGTHYIKVNVRTYKVIIQSVTVDYEEIEINYK